MPARRIALYFAWDRPREAQAELGVLNDRYPSLFELRRALWPIADGLAEVADQGVGGFLEAIVLSDFERFRAVAGQVTSHPVELYERRDAAGVPRPLGDWLQTVNTLIVVSLDHLPTRQSVDDDELAALRLFLAGGDNRLFVSLHHDVGVTNDPPAELAHHGDRLVPGRQQIGGFGRSVLAGLGLDIVNRFGLRPAKAPDGQPVPLEIVPEFAGHPLLAGVSTFNLHPHLPDLHVGPGSVAKINILARQALALDAPAHPALRFEQRHFNALLETRPDAGLGKIVICDATLWSSAFGGDESLAAFWRNVATMP